MSIRRDWEHDHELECMGLNDGGGISIILCIFIVKLTILMEILTRVRSAQDRQNDEAEAAAENRDLLDGTAPIDTTTTNRPKPKSKPQAWDGKKESLDGWLRREIFPLNEKAVGPQTRTGRLIAASFFLAIIIALFVLRIQNYELCGEGTAVVVIFVILPLLSAIAAWLRAFTDVILYRWEMSVADLYWPPFLPFFFVVYMVTLWSMLIVMPCMSRSERSNRDVELGAGEQVEEEEARLISNMEDNGSHDDEYDAPPEYSVATASGSGRGSEIGIRMVEDTHGNKKTTV